MAFSPFRMIGQGFKFIWRVLDAGRRFTLNMIFLAILIVLAIALFSGGGKKLSEKTALILDLKGGLVEQHSGSARESLIAEVQGGNKKSTQLRDILQVLDAASKDPKISSVVLLLDDMDGAGLPMLREVAAAIDRFKANGKKVVAWGSSYDQKQYYLAAHANEVYLHPIDRKSVV